jgi:Fe-S-cluster containining protein
MTATCPPDCGLCCSSIVLGDDVIQRLFHDYPPPSPLLNPLGGPHSEDHMFVREHWHIGEQVALNTTGATTPEADDRVGRRISCDRYDAENNRCGAYDDRPPICARYPFYGRTPEAGEHLDHNVCTYHDDVPGRRVLPLTVLRG